MKKAEAIGSLIGSLVGAVGTGIAIYFTGSIWGSMIGFFGFILGSRIGRAVDHAKEP